MRKLFCFILLVCSIGVATAQSQLSASELLNLSIKYHDPNGEWEKSNLKLQLKELRPDGNERKTLLTIDNSKSLFIIEQQRGDHHLYRKVEAGQCEIQLNQSATYTEEEKKKHRLNCDHSKVLRNYYTYLWGLPMKLKDPGTLLDNSVIKDQFQGKETLKVKVTYEESVGKDIWYFYFDPITYALIGYRFYHDESANDGEYITLEGEAQLGFMRLPKNRKWYTHKENKYLGADILDH